MVQALDKIKGAVGAKGLPILQHVLVEGNTVLAYNSEIGIKVKLSQKAEVAYNVKHDQFLGLLKNMSAEELTIELDKKNRVRIVCGGHSSALSQFDEPFPKPEVAKPDWRALPAGFKEALERTSLAVSKDANNKTLSGLYISGSEMYGLNGRAGVRCTLPEMAVPPVLLADRAVEELTKLGSPKRMSVTDSLALFDFGDLMFLSRVLDHKEYPVARTRELFKDKETRHAVPDGFTMALTRLALIDSEVSAHASPMGLQLDVENSTSKGTEILAAWPEQFPAKKFNPDVMLPLLAYAESFDWGQRDNDLFYMAGEICRYEAIVAPMVDKMKAT